MSYLNPVWLRYLSTRPSTLDDQSGGFPPKRVGFTWDKDVNWQLGMPHNVLYTFPPQFWYEVTLALVNLLVSRLRCTFCAGGHTEPNGLCLRVTK
jgi:hypothetical protein